MRQSPQACRAAGLVFDATLIRCQKAVTSFKELAADLIYNAYCHDATDILVQETALGGVVLLKAYGRSLTFRHVDKVTVEQLLDAFGDNIFTRDEPRVTGFTGFTFPEWHPHAALMVEHYRIRVEMSPGQALIRLVPMPN